MAEGCIKSGLSTMLGQALKGLEAVPLPALQLICISTAVFMTAFCANVPTCNILIPILAELVSEILNFKYFLGKIALNSR